MNIIIIIGYVQYTNTELEKNNNYGVQDNGTLLISEIQNKVILPYTASEVLETYNNNLDKFNSIEEVIKKYYTRDLNDFKHQFSARFKETINLIVKKEKMSYIEGLNIATELLGKKYLHPAIISACKNLNELNVYLDCLDKNELDDFKIFNIKYELYPMLKKDTFNLTIDTNIFQKFMALVKKMFKKRGGKIET